eukprot:s397_g34.t1
MEGLRQRRGMFRGQTLLHRLLAFSELSCPHLLWTPCTLACYCSYDPLHAAQPLKKHRSLQWLKLGFARLGMSTSAPGSCFMGSSPPPRSRAATGAFLSIFGLAKHDVLSLVSDFAVCGPVLEMATSGASLAIRSSLRAKGAKGATPNANMDVRILGLLPPVPDPAKLDVLLAMRSLLRTGLLFLPLQCGSAGSMLPALDFGILDAPLLTQSMVALGAVAPVSDSLNLGPLSSLKALARCGLAPFVPDFVQLGLLSSLRSTAQLGGTAAAHALVALGSTSSASDSLHLGSPLFLRSLAQPDSVVPVLNSARTDSSLLLRSPGCIGLFMSTADSATLASFLLVRGLARLEPATLAVDCSCPDAPLLLRCLACLGPAFSVFSARNSDPIICLVQPRSEKTTYTQVTKPGLSLLALDPVGSDAPSPPCRWQVFIYSQ